MRLMPSSISGTMRDSAAAQSGSSKPAPTDYLATNTPSRHSSFGWLAPSRLEIERIANERPLSPGARASGPKHDALRQDPAALPSALHNYSQLAFLLDPNGKGWDRYDRRIA